MSKSLSDSNNLHIATQMQVKNDIYLFLDKSFLLITSIYNSDCTTGTDLAIVEKTSMIVGCIFDHRKKNRSC